jgi:hypothetical protein
MIVSVLLAPLTACGDGPVPIVCDDLPPAFGPAIVVAEMPAAITLARAVLADDRSMIVWAEASAEPGRSFVRARCLDADGAGIPVDVAILVDGYVNTLAAAPAPGGDAYHVIYGVWAATDGGDPVTLLAADVDCVGSEPVPRQLFPARPGAGAWSLIAAGDAYAFLVTGDGLPSLAIERAGEVTLTALDDEWATLAYDAATETIAAVALVPAGMTIASYGLDGVRRSAPVALPGTAGTYDGCACRDGAGWSIAANTRRDGKGEVIFARLDDAGTPGAPVTISDGSGQSYDPAIACSDRGAAIAYRRNAAGSVPGTDLVVSSIRLLEVDLDGAVVHPPVELDPVGPRLAMFPTVAAGARLVTTWTTYGTEGYAQRWAATGDRCAP